MLVITGPRPRCLDLFCGAGGSARGYQLAGFKVTGVDNRPQPRYAGDEFVCGDALAYAEKHGREFDLIHASPPCQGYLGGFKTMWTIRGKTYPNLIAATRELLISIGLPYVIENVEGAPLVNPLMLCGTMFPELRVRRHRLFETNPVIWFPPATCYHGRKVAKHGRRPNHETELAAVTGHLSDVPFARLAMGIDWMVQGELAQAIPPAYTEYLGRRLREMGL